MRKTAIGGVLALAVAACGSDATVPGQFVGTWGADCSQPFVTFADHAVTVIPDKKDYPLTSASLQGSDLIVGYRSAAGDVTETYAVAGDTLRLDHGL